MRKRLFLIIAVSLMLMLLLTSCELFGMFTPSDSDTDTESSTEADQNTDSSISSDKDDEESDADSDLAQDSDSITDSDSDVDIETDTDTDTEADTDTDTDQGGEEECLHTNLVIDEAVESTCTKAGLTEGKHCGDCGEVIVRQASTAKKPHTEAIEAEIPATCQNIGYTEKKYCSVCKKTIVGRTIIEKLDHKAEESEYIAPTCLDDGAVGGTVCTYCDEILSYGELIPALGHDETIIKGYSATCSREGLSDGKYCNRCEKTTVEQVTLDKSSHAEVITKAIAPTCQSVGYTEKRQCSVCKVVTLESKEIPKSGHTAVTDKAVAPTCSTTGLTEGSHCSVCSTVLVAQAVVSASGDHVYPEFATVTKAQSFSSSGSAKLTCTKCGSSKTITLAKLTASTLTSSDIYSIDTNIYNPAYDNRYKVIDGNTATGGLYSAGNDWFGNVGDVLTITLNQEMILTSLKIYTCGNFTSSKIRTRDAAGNITSENPMTVDNTSGISKTIFSGKQLKAYTIEIEITGLKWNDAKTHKISEIEITGAKPDTRIEHTHVYREFIETSRVATCQISSLDIYECYCGYQKEFEGARSDHLYETLKSITQVSCTEKGTAVYECDCGKTTTVETQPKGHIYYKLVGYTVQPTVSKAGRASFKCINCNIVEEKSVAPLPIEEANYLRVDSISDGKVVLKLNIYGDRPSYEVRYSTSEITEESYSSATKITATVSGDSEVSLTITLDAGLNKCYYVAVKPYSGANYGKMETVRVGGNTLIPIDYEKAQVYHGEVLSSTFRYMFDGDIATAPGTIFYNSTADKYESTNLQGMRLAPIVDLEYMHYVTKVRLYYAEAGKSVTVRWSDTPVDFLAENTAWDGYKTLTSVVGWNEISINTNARYIQVIFVEGEGEAPYEMEAHGYQCGKGDAIATYRGTLPTIGEMMGMCGFVASGGGNTPIDSVSCTTILREYHNFGWTYIAANYGTKAAYFTGKKPDGSDNWMGNFDSQYRSYRNAGINVIPCIQWSLGNGETISYKVGADKKPVYSSGSLIPTTFWERFDPNTYFVYADSMFAFTARYGSNTSSSLLEIAKLHCSSPESVGQNTLEWIEMGNEPEGSWNSIHRYLSAYQLAAATSAAYDGHCSTMVSPSTGGYHLGGKNGSANIKLAMAGVSGISNEYITAMIYWMKANREDGKVAFDAFNVHNYMTRTITLPDGSSCVVGISPEDARIDETLAQLISIRDKYYPEKEVWITEFGWDTNQSYSTSTSAHAYGEYTGRQVQAMWLTRAYLIFSSCGIDKADMYMCEDGGIEETSIGKYGTCGVIAYEYDENGNKIEVKKDSYYYLYTLKSTLGDYTFDSSVEAYDDNVMIYKYKNADGKTAYAVWCKTSDGTKHEGYQLGISADSATLVQSQYGDIDGVRSNLVADEYGYVSVDVSENPVYILVD